MSKFENFSNNDQKIDRQERTKLVEKYLQILPENLKNEAELLKEDGLLVDDSCRIDPAQLLNKHFKYTQEFIDQVKSNLAPLENKFKMARNDSQKVKEGQDIGELLEVVKTLLFNQDLFGGRLKVVRTSRADDVVNGIDEIAIDTKTGFVLGVIDITSSIGSKEGHLDIKMKIGGKLNFGFTIKQEGQKNSITYEPLDELPLYIFEMRLDQILELAKAKATGSYDEDARNAIKLVEKNTLKKFILDGSRILSNQDLSETMRSKYEQANKIFEEILNSIDKKIK